MKYLLHDLLCEKEFVAYQNGRIFEQYLFEIIGKLMNCKKKLHSCVVQIHEKKHNEEGKVITIFQYPKPFYNSFEWVEVWMHGLDVIEEIYLNYTFDFKFKYEKNQINEKSELEIKVYRNVHEMEIKAKDIEKNLEDTIAFSEVAEQSGKLIGEFQEESKNCKTKQEKKKFPKGLFKDKTLQKSMVLVDFEF